MSLNIIEFAEKLLLNEYYRLFLPQKVVLKLFYGLELDEQELELANKWGAKSGNYTTLVLEAGRGATKSTLASIISLYEFYNLIENPNFREQYKLLPNCSRHIIVFGTTAAQVQQTVYGYITGLLKSSPYFLQQLQELSITPQQIKHKTNNISILAKHIDSVALAGYNISCSTVDEIACMDYSILDNLIHSVIKPGSNHLPVGKSRSVYVSSAYEKGDALEVLKESVNKEDTLILSLTTWDLNTSKKREDYEEEYLANPDKFLLEYENIRYK